MPEELSPQKGEFYLAEETDRGTFFIIFRGLWNLLTDNFIGGGIVKSRWEDEGKGTAVLYHPDDEGEMLS